MINIPNYKQNRQEEDNKLQNVQEKIVVPTNDLITEEEMYQGEAFLFGKNIRSPHNVISWNPDDKKTHNGHLMMIGGSGSGKTRLLKQVINYLDQRKKQVYIFDFHGDIKTSNEVCFPFKIRNSQYGISIFNLSLDIDDGGPIAQANNIVAIFRKNFIVNMGAIQKSVLKQFFIDCYRYVGILDEDPGTWQKQIPTMDTLILVYKTIIESAKSKGSYIIYEKYYKLEQYKNKIDEEIDEESINKINNRIDKLIEEINILTGQYYEYIKENKYQGLFKCDEINNISLEFYQEAENMNTLKKLSPYFRDLYTSSIFNDKKPPRTRGVVRYDMSGLTSAEKPTEAMFLADITIQEIFRNIKQQGEFSKRTKDKNIKTSTFIVIDESKLVLPSGKEKENPYNILNRIVTEARKYGLALIIVSQRPSHFPQEIISSIFTKVVLKVNENDAKEAKKDLGIKPEYLFSHLEDAEDGAILVGETGSMFQSVATPWYRVIH
jgi:hypothetical protein